MSEIIKTEHLTFSYPPDEGKEPVLALGGVSLGYVINPTKFPLQRLVGN